jgi:DNA-binding transcriptional regulator YdaS (Cro superfamily)
MNLNTWLDNEAGRAAKLASHFGRSASAVSQWRKNGVPVDFMKSVRDFTGGAVTLEEMIPEAKEKVSEGV